MPRRRRYGAGERLRGMQESRPGEGRHLGRALRNIVLLALALAIGFSVVGYFTGVPVIRSTVDDAVYAVTGLFAKPVRVEGVSVTGTSATGGNAAANVVDGRQDYWAATRAKLPATLTFTFSGPIDLTSIVIIAHPHDAGSGFPGNIRIVLPDGTSIEKNVAANLSGSADQPSVTFPVSARGIKSLRLIVLSVEPSNSAQVAIAEVQFYRRP